MQNTHQRPKQAQTLMGTANDNLSRAASAIKKHNDDYNFIAEDLAAFGAPAECYHLAFKSEDSDRDKAVQKFGFATYEEFNNIVAERCNGKVAYFYC